jgi:hypothetical protein
LDTLARLRDALVVRDYARTELKALEGDTARAARQPKALADDVRRQISRIAGLDRDVEELRAKLVSEKQKAETEKTRTEEALAALAAGQGAPQAGGKEEAALRDRLAKVTAKLAAMENGISAQSPQDLPAAVGVSGRDRTTADIMQDPALSRYTHVDSLHWPGATVPERLIMLFKESKESDSRRPIVISSIVIAVITIVMLGVTLISGALNPADGRSPIGKGELFVPVLVADADDVGTLEMTIEFDEAVLTAITATPGPIATGAVVECNTETPGKMTLRLVDVTGTSGSGAVMLLRFAVDDIVLEAAVLDVTATSASGSMTMAPIAVEFEDGSINTATLESVAPVVRF